MVLQHMLLGRDFGCAQSGPPEKIDPLKCQGILYVKKDLKLTQPSE